MNSLSKSAAASLLHNWEAPDLDVEVDESATQLQSEQLLALFSMRRNGASRGAPSGPRSNIHPNGSALSLANWFPDDIRSQPAVIERESWGFVETYADSLVTVDPLSVKNKSAVEKEKAKLLQDARAQADEMLRQARLEASQMIQQAQVEIEQAKNNAHQKGWNEARNELQMTIAAARELVDETHRWQETFLKESEQILTGMMKELAQSMFGEGVRLDADALQINLSRIMDNAQRLGDLNIFLNPQDANLLDTSWRDYQLLITGNKVRIIPSEKIKPGGCIIKGNMGMVDARVETQLAAILREIDEVKEAGK